ncbi:Hypothetical predicted protein [Cloeon dipterum]|uniref:LNS2/PITP domain-containing protein n=1 Tax=Cloeon dipterum TaxID=197152 RepID=A0A8S1D072_9INSE|nr:Hypothetical predicted protein [Cloeon dipterum]
MKLGESGEAFFVEELSGTELESFPSYLACSPIPLEGEQLMLEKFGQKSPKPISPLAQTPPAETGESSPHRGGATLAFPPLSPLHEAQEAGGATASPVPKTFRAEMVSEEMAQTGSDFRPIHKAGESASQEEEQVAAEPSNGQANGSNGGSKNSRRKRRRKSLLKKNKQQQSMPNNSSNQDDCELDNSQVVPGSAADEAEETQFQLEDVSTTQQKEVCTQHLGGVMLSGYGNSAEVTYSLECSKCAETCSKLADCSNLASDLADEKRKPADLHFFSDTEATPCCSFTPADLAALQGLNLICQPFWSAHINQNSLSDPINHGSRAGSPTPQSDSELELRRQSSAAEPTQLEAQLQAELGVGGKQSWKWGELPSPPPMPPRMLVEGSSESQESSPAGRLPSYRSSDEEELNEIAAKSALKEDAINKEGEGYSGSNSSDESDSSAPANRIAIPHARLRLDSKNKIYRKTLRLSSDQIASLQLKEGANEVVFSVTTAYQGTTRCKCHVYRWRWDDKIVISDIDGTITKSDVLGHILPVLGRDWAQSGVAQLFTKIKNNGYRLLYLSARAIGQARTTRDYLKSIKQGDLSLPEGPLLLNPTSLISALHREVIEKKPEEFKISCLRDVQALFPSDCKPFYAGYGNKINDVWAYRAVGIPIFRIFTINHRGELKHELTQTFQSSYMGQSDAVDDIFPIISHKEPSSEYSNMSYIVDQMFPPPVERQQDPRQGDRVGQITGCALLKPLLQTRTPLAPPCSTCAAAVLYQNRKPPTKA